MTSFTKSLALHEDDRIFLHESLEKLRRNAGEEVFEVMDSTFFHDPLMLW
jgi:hypothetical protein